MPLSSISPPPSRRRSRKSTLALLTLPLVLFAATTTTTAALASTLSSAGSPTETLHETLLLKPLADGRVLSSFEFTLTSTSSSTSHYRLLPRTLLQPIQHYGAEEVHLALNSGRWRYTDWESPVTSLTSRQGYDEAQGKGKVRLGEESVGVGAELWARFEGQDAGEGEWKGLTSALAGLFCASLDALDERQTVQPHFAYSEGVGNGSRVLHAILPTEGVCTENLTPFVKLLPCKRNAGLAALLNPLSLFSADFHGLGVHVVRLPAPIPGQEGKGGWQVKLTFTSVFSPALTRDVSIRDWSISSLFGRTLQSTCPMAESSVVRILKPNDPEGSAKYKVDPLPPFPACALPGDEYRCRKDRKKSYPFFPRLEEQDEVTDELASSDLLAFETDDQQASYDQRLHKRWEHYLDTADGEYLYDVSKAVSSNGGLDVKMSWPHETRFSYPSRPNTGQVQVERTLIGSGQERALLQVVFTNPDKVVQRVLWYETLGYFVKPYLHTLRHETTFLPSSFSNSSSVDDDWGDVEEGELVRGAQDLLSPIEELVYQPTTPTGGRKPFVMESVLRLPARSRVVITFEVRKVFVAYSQHPPDAHRGFDLNGAIIVPLLGPDPREEALEREKDRQRRRHGEQRIGRISSISSQSTGHKDLWQQITNILHPQKDREIHPTLRSPKSSKTNTRIYTLPRLVELATPDFSFVYTNIIFTSTVIALFFGSSLNTLLRSFTDFLL